LKCELEGFKSEGESAHMHALLFLESIGTTELLVILVAALILFGPRRLPELSRSLGKSLSEFKRASDDFKRTWEREVEVERVEQQERIERAMVGAPDAALQPAEQTTVPATTAPPLAGESIARGVEALAAPAAVSPAAAPTEPTRKSDWL
jgi:sec-independent protein translocase protein TatA